MSKCRSTSAATNILNPIIHNLVIDLGGLEEESKVEVCQKMVTLKKEYKFRTKLGRRLRTIDPDKSQKVNIETLFDA
jgi:hypothetical protein